MRLNALYESYWQPIANHPGQLGKRDKRAKKNDKSFLVHPEDRKRWLKWFSGGKTVKEALDDKDTFGAPTGALSLEVLTSADEISQYVDAGPPFIQRLMKEGPVYMIFKGGEPYAMLTDHLRNNEGYQLKTIGSTLANFLMQKIEAGEVRGKSADYVMKLIEISKQMFQRRQARQAQQ